MTTGADIIYGGSGGLPTRLANGSSGQVLTSQGTTVAPVWGTPVSVGGAWTVTSVKTSNYNAVINDYIPVNGTSGGFTVTLPTAAGVSGQIIGIKRTDMTLANVINVATTSAQTIDGASSKNLYTQNEEWIFVSDGSNWYVQAHNSLTSQQTYTVLITATGSNPTKGSSPTFDKSIWWRNGSFLHMIYEFAQVNAGTAGSGTYLFSIPVTADSTNLTMATTNSAPCVGSGCFGTNSPAGMNYGIANLYSTTQIVLNAGGNQASSGFAGLDNATIKYGFSIQIPVSGWES